MIHFCLKSGQQGHKWNTNLLPRYPFIDPNYSTEKIKCSKQAIKSIVIISKLVTYLISYRHYSNTFFSGMESMIMYKYTIAIGRYINYNSISATH